MLGYGVVFLPGCCDNCVYVRQGPSFFYWLKVGRTGPGSSSGVWFSFFLRGFVEVDGWWMMMMMMIAAEEERMGKVKLFFFFCFSNKLWILLSIVVLCFILLFFDGVLLYDGNSLRRSE